MFWSLFEVETDPKDVPRLLFESDLVISFCDTKLFSWRCRGCSGKCGLKGWNPSTRHCILNTIYYILYKQNRDPNFNLKFLTNRFHKWRDLLRPLRAALVNCFGLGSNESLTLVLRVLELVENTERKVLVQQKKWSTDWASF